MATVRLTGTKSKGSPTVSVEVPGITDEELAEIRKNLRRLSKKEGPSDAIAKTFLQAVRKCPEANPSDLWLYGVYLEYVKSVRNEQSWKRSSGYAFERVIEERYRAPLATLGLEISILSVSRAKEVLDEFGLSSFEVPPTKLDMSIRIGMDTRKTVAILHAKVSVAERISDDAPASRLLMSKGCASAILTLDMKHFPPPHGDGVNYGELGGRPALRGQTKEYQQKRAYIEESGDFDALFSFNTRTPPSPPVTPSGKKIFMLSFSEKLPDAFTSWVSLLRKR